MASFLFRKPLPVGFPTPSYQGKRMPGERSKPETWHEPSLHIWQHPYTCPTLLGALCANPKLGD